VKEPQRRSNKNLSQRGADKSKWILSLKAVLEKCNSLSIIINVSNEGIAPYVKLFINIFC